MRRFYPDLCPERLVSALPAGKYPSTERPRPGQETPSIIIEGKSGGKNREGKTEGPVCLAADKLKPRDHSGAVTTEAEISDEKRPESAPADNHFKDDSVGADVVEPDHVSTSRPGATAINDQ